jgi:hypothetical protein
MPFKEITAVYSDNHTTPQNTEYRLTDWWSNWYTQLPLGFKELRERQSSSTCLCKLWLVPHGTVASCFGTWLLTCRARHAPPGTRQECQPALPGRGRMDFTGTNKIWISKSSFVESKVDHVRGMKRQFAPEPWRHCKITLGLLRFSEALWTEVGRRLVTSSIKTQNPLVTIPRHIELPDWLPWSKSKV